MSGHSKWAQIKHKKAVVDAKRGNLFSKLARAIAIAAKEGGADPATNAKLQQAVERARSFNLPTENIERALAKAVSQKGAGDLVSVIYEAYGPGGSALVIEGITDNKNRTAAEIRHLLGEHGGKFAETGTVAWMFNRRGVIVLPRQPNPRLDEPDTELALIDAGADEIEQSNDAVTVFTAADKRRVVAANIQSLGFRVSDSSDMLIAKNEIYIHNEQSRETFKKLVDLLEAHDDIQQVSSNVENL